MYIESEKHYLTYYIAGRNMPIRERGSIKECEEKLEKYDFVKIHKRYLINLKYLADFDGSRNEVTISKTDKKLTMSKNYKKNVDEKYTLYLRSIL
jgi:DNA-binding LytR/AlgR family response regulator